MGRIFVRSLNNVSPLLRCSACGTHLADPEHVISNEFQGTLGPAYLIQNVFNVFPGPQEERMLITGVHIVRDVSCVSCQTVLGWRYDEAYEESQKYKKGKYILEKTRVCCVEADAAVPSNRSRAADPPRGEERVEEDERAEYSVAT